MCASLGLFCHSLEMMDYIFDEYIHLIGNVAIFIIIIKGQDGSAATQLQISFKRFIRSV